MFISPGVFQTGILNAKQSDNLSIYTVRRNRTYKLNETAGIFVSFAMFAQVYLILLLMMAKYLSC